MFLWKGWKPDEAENEKDEDEERVADDGRVVGGWAERREGRGGSRVPYELIEWYFYGGFSFGGDNQK